MTTQSDTHFQNTILADFLQVCSVGSRSDAQTCLLTLQRDLGDPGTLDSSGHMVFLLNVLKDLNGKQLVRDITFLPRLRNELVQISDRLGGQKLDLFMFNSLFHLELGPKAWHHVRAYHPAIQAIFSGHDTTMNATFSSHAIERFYRAEQWRQMRHIPMPSRVALWYRWVDPLDLVPLYQHMQGTDMDNTIADELSQLLKVFAEPVAAGTRSVEVLLEQALKSGCMGTITRAETEIEGILSCALVTATEIPVAPRVSSPIPGGTQTLGIGETLGHNIVIRINSWLTRDETLSTGSKLKLFPQIRERSPEEAWIVPGLQLSYKEYDMDPGTLTLNFQLSTPPKGAVRFNPMHGGVLVDSRIKFNTRAAPHHRAAVDAIEDPRTAAVAEDPFWTDVYCPALLVELGSRAHGTRDWRAPVYTIQQHLLEVERVCTGGTRADAKTCLLGIKERLGADASADRHLRFLMGVLKDITGAQPVRDLDFFVRLRDAVDGPAERLKYDRFLWNTVYFLNVDYTTWETMAKKHPVLHQAMRDTFSGNGTAAARVATFSSHAIERLFDAEKWVHMQEIPMVSRVALWYRWIDPVHKVHTDHGPLADELSQLLRCFAQPIAYHEADMGRIQVVLPDARLCNIAHTVTTESSTGGGAAQTCTIVLTEEIPLPYVRDVVGGSYFTPPDSVRDLDVEGVYNKPTCIRVKAWLTPPPDTGRRVHNLNEAWIVPGWLLSYTPGQGLRLSQPPPSGAAIRFNPMYGRVPVDTPVERYQKMHTTRRIRNQVVREISEHVHAITQ